jgi:predicted DNA-binding transcriptional regulator AlpA
MRTYEFSIVASGLDPQAEDFESRFYDVGCDDALVSFQKGHIIVDFAREAASADAAIASAVEAVRSVGATVDRVEPDPLVSLAEIASRTGLTRAAVTQYAKGQRASGFPSPVAKITSDSSLWDWASVATWLFRHKKVSREVALEAQIVKRANELIERREPQIGQRLRERARECEAAL